ncbi:MAG TPA: TolC family protein [Opitutaceae bacterium]|nr:TolC family protein [Opitutaceae bacterium]
MHARNTLLCFAWLVCLAGCASRRAPAAHERGQEIEISPAQRAERFDARTLRDPGLRQFLEENLGRVPPEPWDFETLCWVGFYFHPALQLARAQWATAHAAQTTANARPNPTLTLTPGFDSTRTPGLSPWMPSINFDFLFPTSGKRGIQQSITAWEAESARLAVLSTAWQLRSELRRALIDISMARRRETIARAQLETQRRIGALMEQRFVVGSISATEVSTARTTLFRAEAAAADAAGQSTIARARVAAALGLPMSALESVALPEFPSAPPLSEKILAAARRESLQTRADILGALSAFSAARAGLQLEVAKRMPDIHLGPGYQWDQGDNKWTLGISFELPIFNRNEGPIAEARARMVEALAKFDVTQSQAIASIDQAVAAQRIALQQLKRARQLRAEVEKLNRAVQQNHALGGADEIEVETAELNTETSDASVADAENAAALAAGQLEDALQLPFPHVAEIAKRLGQKTETP